MVGKLNDKQRKLVADNHKLIYGFLEFKNLSLDEAEDWYGIAAEGLCKAGLVFEEERGVKFSTFAFACMENEVRSVFRKNEIKNVISLDYPVDGTDNITMGDLIPDNTNYEDLVILFDAVSSAYCTLSDKKREFVDLILNGMSRNEAARTTGYSKTRVCDVYNEFLREVKKSLALRIAE